ncbi:MAG TPA: hypothetical protein VII69_11375 [Candidatus Eremiobacteraceae bacterium]
MNRIAAFRLVSVVFLCLGAIAFGSAIHLPALAAEGFNNYIAPAPNVSCSSTSPCLAESNTSSGAGVKGSSTAGNGSIGTTKFKSTSQGNGTAGVFGQDLSTSGTFDSGVFGSSTNGVGVQGTSINGLGMMATSTNQTALFVQNIGASDGIQAVALSNDGTNSSTQNNSSIRSGRSGVWGHDDSTDGGFRNFGVAGTSTNGIGVLADSTNWIGLDAVGGGLENGAHGAALSVTGGQSAANVILACADVSDNPCTRESNSIEFILDHNGDLRISGHIYTSGSCGTGCAIGRDGSTHRVSSYAPTQTVPSIDDFGEAQLVGGHAYVKMNADFANVVDQHANYLVFITPEGDSRGLYVTEKTRAGFTVRENQDGRSTLAFSYRIVAKPLGVEKPRLPMESVGPRRQTGDNRVKL